MRFEDKQEMIAEANEEALYADGFESCLVGLVQIFNKTLPLYNRDKCIALLMERDGMTEDEAEEFFDFNVTGSYFGENTPAFATFFPEED